MKLKELVKQFIPMNYWNTRRKASIIRQQGKVADFWAPILKAYYNGEIERYSLKPKKKLGTQKVIWQYWGQGIDKDELPEIIQICFDSVDRNKNDYQVIRLTDITISEYIDLPDFVWRKREYVQFTRTFFSDLLRVALLSTYGGVWLDATILLTGSIPAVYEKTDFFMYQRSDEEKNKKYWENVYAYYFGWEPNFKVRMLSSILFAQKESEIISTLTDLLLYFWKTQDSLPAYLIMAHHEFEVLGKLVQALDDERNDIYIHFDKKVKNYPLLKTKYTNLYILQKRTDIRWGHISQIKAEYALFEAAFMQDRYDYYHLLSGVHLPLKSQSYIHHFFEGLKDKEVLVHVPNSDYQTHLKMRRYNFFTKNFMHKVLFIRRINQLLWRVCIRIQKELHICRNRNQSYTNAANWVSITGKCIGYLLQIKKDVLRKYRFTLCGDEFFIPSELGKSYLKDRIYYDDKLLKCDFDGGSNPRIYHLGDYDELISSGCLFARKFSYTDMHIVDKILIHITADQE